MSVRLGGGGSCLIAVDEGFCVGSGGGGGTNLITSKCVFAGR